MLKEKKYKWKIENSAIRATYWDAIDRKARRIKEADWEKDISVNDDPEKIEAWFQNFKAKYKSQKHIKVDLTEKTRHLIELFCQRIESINRHEITVKEYRRSLQKASAILDKHSSPELWPQHSIHLKTELLNAGESMYQVKRIQMHLKKFWTYLLKYQKGFAGSLPLDDEYTFVAIETPLQFHITPQMVLKFVKKCKSTPIKILALCGYFASLRPQETFGLSIEDFFGGKEAEETEACKIMKKAKLYGGFAVDVVRQRGKKKPDVRNPKKSSGAIVALFNKESAQFLIEELQKIDGQIFKYGNDFYTREWSEHGYPDITLKDLRRASLYWLGHYSELKLENLQLHARHKDPKTTALYYRRVYHKPVTRQLIAR